MDLMGNKSNAISTARSLQVPVVPGSEGALVDPVHAEGVAEEIGFPVLIKATHGGGGKGIHIVDDLKEFQSIFSRMSQEALSAFGNGDLYLEKMVVRPRHIEVQIMGDSYGNVVHLGERECSLQRRHQKVLEEAPSPLVTPEMRAAIGKAAVDAAKAIGYSSAGTVEFLADEDRNFYFIEMNTRIQVEHPVTEMITGIDIVGWQIRIAAGEALSLRQDDIQAKGHALEFRLYAEDPIRCMPQPGTIDRWEEPSGEGVRVDHAVYSGMEVTPFYDPMLAKLIIHAESRHQALQRAQEVLDSLVLEGITHNAPLHAAVLLDPDFQAGDVHTGLLAGVQERIVAT